MNLARQKLAMRLAATLLGGVLLIAGLLKASDSFSALYHFGSVATSGRSAASGMLLLAIIEMAAAMALIQRPFHPAAWRLALLLFAAFFIVALTQASVGRQVCDCFGAIVLKPHYTALFDLLATCVCVAALWLLRRPPLEEASAAMSAASYPSVIAFVLAFFSLLLLRESRLGDARYGVPPVVAELQLDQQRPGDVWIGGSALLASRGSKPVRVVGFVQNCGLQIKRLLPFEIEPSTVTRLPLFIRRPAQAQVGLIPLTLFIEVGGTLEKLTLPMLTPHLKD